MLVFHHFHITNYQAYDQDYLSPYEHYLLQHYLQHKAFKVPQDLALKEIRESKVLRVYKEHKVSRVLLEQLQM